MRRRKKRSKIEIVAGSVGALLAIVATVASPRLHEFDTTEELVAKSALKSERIEVLEELLLTSYRNNSSLRAQLAENNLLRNKAYGQLEELVEQRNEAKEKQEALGRELAAAKEEIRQLHEDIELANAKLEQNRELEAKYALASERDAALDKAKKAEDRIRELTLKLSKNGIWP